MSPDAVLALPDVVKRYMAGESVQDIAKDCRVTRRTIYNWMLSGLGDDAYHELVTQCLVARVSDADQELEEARSSKDPVRVTAARETARFARMDLERRRPSLYGPKQEVKHSASGPMLSIVLLTESSGGGEGGRVLPGTPVLEQLPGPVVAEQEKQAEEAT